MAGDRDDRIEDIGYLKKGVERLEKALDDKDRKDDEVRRERDRKEEQFRKSMYEMMPVVKSNFMLLEDHSTQLETVVAQLATLTHLQHATTQITESQGKQLVLHDARLGGIEKERAEEAAARVVRVKSRRAAMMVNAAWISAATTLGGAAVWLVSTFWTQMADIIIQGSGLDGR